MKFDWELYLSVAKNLAAPRLSIVASPPYPAITQTEEACLRAAISRAYYAAFIKARNYLRDSVRIAYLEDYSHWDVIEVYNEPSDPIYFEINQELDWLRKLRNRCDYDDEVAVDKLDKRAKEALWSAKKTIGNVNTLIVSRPPKP